MKTFLIKGFNYNGLFISAWPRKKKISVEVVGCHIPVDPGFVVIKLKNNHLRTVPTLALKDAPRIDFRALLTAEQLGVIKENGILWGRGVGGPVKFKPLKECPLKGVELKN
jgi:hypothetical protein